MRNTPEDCVRPLVCQPWVVVRQICPPTPLWARVKGIVEDTITWRRSWQKTGRRHVFKVAVHVRDLKPKEDGTGNTVGACLIQPRPV
jgi:hypothetical protein